MHAPWRHRAAPRATPRPPLPGVVERHAVVDRAGLGASQRGHVRAADRSPRAAPRGGDRQVAAWRPGLLARRTDSSPRSSSASCSATSARACSASTTSRCCRPRRARASSVRRGEHPRHGGALGRLARATSGPGSRSTRRPTPSSSRRTPGCGRTCASVSSARSRLFWTGPASSRRAASGALRALARREARDNAARGVHDARSSGACSTRRSA